MCFVRKHVVRQRIAQTRRDREERVKPAARLVNSLRYKIGGIVALEGLAILERKMPLRERHRSRIEPCIDDFWRARLRSSALALPGVSVDERLVGIEALAKRDAGSPRELFVTSYGFGVRRI